MSSLVEHWRTDWAAMTVNDWIGTILTVVIFVLMVLVYFQVLRPKNRERLESRRFIPFDDEERSGDDDGRE
ncbi:cbb3-type cytochrome c oxidase subunit 3 [Thiococcus pfennigii]|uniref:cbb3-type cytochrome c oxidase subunit 3 n=1 Tax=Thiococcus pfennigii TaxID=1057 RepID=UPI0019063A73